MEEVIKIFTELQNVNSRIEKERIIKENKDNKLFKKCLVFLLDGNITTGISEKKINKNVGIVMGFIPDFESCINYLKEHNTGTDADIAIIKQFIDDQPKEHKGFYEQMVTKTYRLGCDAKTINKCIPNLIPVFNVMLGTPIEKCKLKDGEWIGISRKLNGTRAAFVGNKIMTRQGKEYKGLDHIINDLINMDLSNMFIDGELIYKNKEGLSDSEAFQKGTGIANSKDKDKSELKLVVFDMFPLDEFWTGKSIASYYYRKNVYLGDLKERLSKYPTDNIEIVTFCYEGTDHSQIWKWLDYAEEHDWEGIILNLDTPYECKRTKNLIKVKRFFSCDIRCIGVEEGNGRNKGTLGALNCDYKGNKVNVGSGFTDEQRKYYWYNQDEVIGKIISVKYKEETKNKDGGVSIQFPVFECVRFDKIEPSYN